MRRVTATTAGSVLLSLSLLAATKSSSAGQIQFLNDTPWAPRIVLRGGPLFFSDNPEDVSQPGITYADVLRDPGWFRVFDYHTNISGEPLFLGVALRNGSSHAVVVGMGRHAMTVSGAVPWVGQVTYWHWLRSAGPGQVVRRYVVPPRGTVSWSQQVPANPPGALVSEIQLDLEVLSGFSPGALQIVTFASPTPVPNLDRLKLLPFVPGEVRATYPHTEAVGTIFALPDRTTAVGLFNVSGPAVGYTAPDDALPGESQEGWDAVDHRPVWSKGPYGVDYRLTLLPPRGAGAMSLGVTTTHLTKEGLPHAGNGYVFSVDGDVHVVTGAYLPRVQSLGTVRGPAILETSLPGGASAPQYLFVRTTGGQALAPPGRLSLALYGQPSPSPRTASWVTVPVPSDKEPLQLRLGPPRQSLWGFPVHVLVKSGGDILSPPYTIASPNLYVASTVPVVLPFSLRDPQGRVVESGTLHFAAFTVSSGPVGPDGGTFLYRGYGIVVLPHTLSRITHLRLETAPGSLPPLPPGWKLAGPPVTVSVSPPLAPARPLLLDADDLSRLDGAVAHGESTRIWCLTPRGWTAVHAGNGDTPWDHGFDLAYWLPGWGTYAVTYRPRPSR